MTRGWAGLGAQWLRSYSRLIIYEALDTAAQTGLTRGWAGLGAQWLRSFSRLIIYQALDTAARATKNSAATVTTKKTAAPAWNVISPPHGAAIVAPR